MFLAVFSAELAAQTGLHTGERQEPDAASCEKRVAGLQRQISSLANQALSQTADTIAENKAIYKDIEVKRRERMNLSQKAVSCRNAACPRMIETQSRSLDSQISELERRAQANFEKRLNALNRQREALEKMVMSLQASPDCMAPGRARPAGVPGQIPAAADKEDAGTEAKGSSAVKRAMEIIANTGKEKAKALDCSGLVGTIYPELGRDKMIKAVKDCPEGAGGCECAPEARPCSRHSQKQYEHLRRLGRIKTDITKISEGDVLFFKEEEQVVHVVIADRKSKKSGRCTKADCPMSFIYTSKGDPFKQRELKLEDGCYSWCTSRPKIFNKEKNMWECAAGASRKQCFVGGGTP
ncbi:MAG: hypothetical protein RDU13_00895 [Elusimicrobiales bacterium]|nr:hypothetical protein [Elusimicrobiales bacterium]